MYQFLTAHYEVLLLAGGYVVLSAVNSLPDPTQKFEFYPWFYHTMKQLMNNVPAKYLPREEPKATSQPTT